MGPRARYLPLVAVLGAVLGGLPALATSAGSTPTISGLESKVWSPSEVTIGAGGSVIFKNASTTLEHSLKFLSGPGKPVCTGVPESGKTNWEGSCSFSAAGTYTFFCTVHPFMKGTVVVTPAGTTTTTTNTTGTTTGTTTPTTGTTPTTTDKHTTTGPGTTTGSREGGGTQPGVSGSPGAPGAAGGLSGGPTCRCRERRWPSPPFSTARACTAPSWCPPGRSRLVIQLLAATGQLSKAGTATSVGSLTRSGLHTGKASFAVAISSRAQRALHRRGRLKLLVHLTLSAAGAGSAHRTVTVQLRAG